MSRGGLIEGVHIGHASAGASGVTVVVVPGGAVASGEVRGGAPATRELGLLEPTRTVGRVDAVVLAGGSALGLAAADGVVRFLTARGMGYTTAAGPVPIVVGGAVFDLVASGGAFPGADDGHAAATAALRGETPERGRVGAGRAATVGKWRGADHAVPGGLGMGLAFADGARVLAIAVVNAVGDVVGPEGSVLAGVAPAARDGEVFPAALLGDQERANTTIAALVTDARLDKTGCFLVAQSAHDGFARAIHPAHTRFDGDLAIVLATGRVDALIDRVRIAAVAATESAIRDAVAAEHPALPPVPATRTPTGPEEARVTHG